MNGSIRRQHQQRCQHHDSSAVRTVRTPVRAKNYDDALREHIVEVLRETNGIVAGPRGAAVRLGLARTTLVAKMQKLGITPDRTLSTPAPGN
jgi:transcriptional regulator with GAF, ATPase, and Fis domain